MNYILDLLILDFLLNMVDWTYEFIFVHFKAPLKWQQRQNNINTETKEIGEEMLEDIRNQRFGTIKQMEWS